MYVFLAHHRKCIRFLFVRLQNSFLTLFNARFCSHIYQVQFVTIYMCKCMWVYLYVCMCVCVNYRWLLSSHSTFQRSYQNHWNKFQIASSLYFYMECAHTKPQLELSNERTSSCLFARPIPIFWVKRSRRVLSAHFTHIHALPRCSTVVLPIPVSVCALPICFQSTVVVFSSAERTHTYAPASFTMSIFSFR